MMTPEGKRKMDALTARALLFQRKLAELQVEISLPGLEALDHQLSVLEIPGDSIQEGTELAKGPDGNVNAQIVQAFAICRSLVLRETKERIFSDTDVEAVAKFGISITKPLSDLVSEVSGMADGAVSTAKKNSLAIAALASSTSSTVNSEPPVEPVTENGLPQ